MKKEIDELKFKLNLVKEAVHENARLSKILELKEKGPYDFVVAQIIAKEPTNWLNSLIINKGQNQGIVINQPVMSFSNLVGKIIEVGAGTAKVMLISDANSRVVSLIQRTRTEGMLEGMGNGLCRLKYLPINADVKLGDEVVSAGVGGVYPKGLIIGNIESIRIERGGIYKSGIVKPTALLSGLEEVLCLKSNLKQ
ncbi:MAG: rod shape-determining protein MreC [Candidatus Omnitrophica bacterium]|nr:rod shape-determining protein MreC [Candidatus Omnitrophota bacterium]